MFGWYWLADACRLLYAQEQNVFDPERLTAALAKAA
jgi:hypothetical protein